MSPETPASDLATLSEGTEGRQSPAISILPTGAVQAELVPGGQPARRTRDLLPPQT